METLEVLERARALITPPEAWTTKAFARTAKGILFPEGQRVQHSAPEAVCWCAVGACRKAAGVKRLFDENYAASDRAVQALGKQLRPEGWEGSFADVHSYNDDHTHAEVLALFDRAIAAEKAKETA